MKMTTLALGSGDEFYIFSGGNTNLEFGEIKVFSKIRKVKTFGMNMFNTIGIVCFFISLGCHFDITCHYSVKQS